MSTLAKSAEAMPKANRRRLVAVMDQDAYLRLKHAAAKAGDPVGTFLSDLVVKSLPAVEGAAVGEVAA